MSAGRTGWKRSVAARPGTPLTQRRSPGRTKVDVQYKLPPKIQRITNPASQHRGLTSVLEWEPGSYGKLREWQTLSLFRVLRTGLGQVGGSKIRPDPRVGAPRLRPRGRQTRVPAPRAARVPAPRGQRSGHAGRGDEGERPSGEPRARSSTVNIKGLQIRQNATPALIRCRNLHKT